MRYISAMNYFKVYRFGFSKGKTYVDLQRFFPIGEELERDELKALEGRVREYAMQMGGFMCILVRDARCPKIPEVGEFKTYKPRHLERVN